MLLDRLLQLSDVQALTATAISHNVIDLGPLGGGNTIRDIGAGEELNLSVFTGTAFGSAGGTAVLTITLESSAAEALSAATVHWTSSAFTVSALTANKHIIEGITIPPGAYKRYLGLRYTVTTENFNAGTLKAWLHKGRFDTRTYKSGYSTGVN